MASVTFNYQTWVARFPELADAVAEPLALAYFAEVPAFVRNDTCLTGGDAGLLLAVMNLLVAHLAALYAPVNGQPASPLVGRISSATQGSVSVSTTMDLPQAAQWFAQSRYGAQAWQMLKPAMSMHYLPGRTRNMNPWIGGYRRG